MSHPMTPPTHPVLGCVATVRDALDGVAEVEPLFMAVADKEAALVGLAAAAAQLDELRLRVLGRADDVAEAHGARDAGAWLAHATRLDGRVGRGDLALARVLGRRPALAAAMRAGRLDRAQAAVIARVIDDLPDDLPVDVLDRAEAHLTEKAADFDPRGLRILGGRLLAVVAPDLDDEHERRRLEDEEARAEAVTKLTTRRRGDGTTDIHVRCPDAVADRLLTYLESLTSPRQQATDTASEPDAPDAPDTPDTGPDDRRPYPQRLGHAFIALLERWDPTRLPLHGGAATTVVVTVDLDTLLEGLSASGVALIGDQPISAAQARRLACTAHLVPAVLGGESQVLDLGRGRRLYSHHQRTAMALRDHTCRADGCTIPAAWCEAHHLTPWSHGGRTDLDDGVLLCSHHHHRAHDHRYDLTRRPDGTVTFHRRV